jgi:hypothetical protein
LQTVHDIMYGRISNTPRPQRWGLIIGRYDRRIIWFERGERLAHYDADMTTVAYFGDLPAAMTRQNCEDYRFTQGQIVYQPQR